MTQSELSDILNVTRQAVSKYENGDSFPDVSVLVVLSETFGVTIDNLINSGEPSEAEAALLQNVTLKKEIPNEIFNENIQKDIVNIAPFLKPSILDKAAVGLSKHGIDISSITALAEYLNDKSVLNLLESANFNSLDEEMLEKFMPFLDDESREVVFGKILDGELNYNLIRAILPYSEYMITQIEAAVVEGALDIKVLGIIGKYIAEKTEKYSSNK